MSVSGRRLEINRQNFNGWLTEHDMFRLVWTEAEQNNSKQMQILSSLFNNTVALCLMPSLQQFNCLRLKIL